MESSKISGMVLYAIILVSVVIFGMFFFGDVETETVPGLEAPVYTNLMMVFMYILFGVALIATLGAAFSSFFIEMKKDPKEAIKSVGGILFFALIFLVSWFLADDTTLQIRGYEGSENVPFWLKWTDMILFSSYILFAIAILCILAGAVGKKISNK